jgi:hypothetical protein
MIVLYKAATQNVVLTLTEKQLLVNPNYLFVFTNRTTNVKTSFIKLNAADTSLYKDRYNKFSFVVDTLFPSGKVGFYVYNVYEQVSDTNTDPAGLNLLETGMMEIKPATAPQIFTERESVNTFITA